MPCELGESVDVISAVCAQRRHRIVVIETTGGGRTSMPGGGEEDDDEEDDDTESGELVNVALVARADDIVCGSCLGCLLLEGWASP